MQSYPINLFGGGSQTFSTDARRFIYESGQTAPIGGDARVIVKPDTGNEIVLRPGQAFGLAPGESAANWYVRPFDPAARITGTAIIGSGDFSDGTFKVDSSTGTIAVRPEGGFQIMNTDANRVPVALDAVAVKAMSEAPIVTYNASRVAANMNSAGTWRELLKASDNVNGVIIENLEMTPAAGSYATVTILAKEVQPGHKGDGDVVIGNFGYAPNGPRWNRMQINAGKGLWIFIVTAAADCNVSALLTIK